MTISALIYKLAQIKRMSGNIEVMTREYPDDDSMDFAEIRSVYIRTIAAAERCGDAHTGKTYVMLDGAATQ